MPLASGTSPMRKFRPTSCERSSAAGSMRVTRPSASKATMRAPMSMAVMAATAPPTQMAIFAVPPPMSTFITLAPSRIDSAAAPEPKAARLASSASPALTATNLPACAAKSSPMARALRRRTATPVRMSAPLST